MIESSMSSGCWNGRSRGRGIRWRRACRCGGGILLPQLQRTNVGDDSPAVLHRNLWCVRRHRAPAVRDCVEEMSDRRLSQAIVVERSSATEATTNDHAVAVSCHTVTRGTENVVALTTAIDDLLCYRKRKTI